MIVFNTKLPIKNRRFFKSNYKFVLKQISLDPKETIIIVMDAWDKHWCKNVNLRMPEIANRINLFINKYRSYGVPILHIPNDCIDFYKNSEARNNTLKNKIIKSNFFIYYGVKHSYLKHGLFPMPYLYNNGCNCEPTCNVNSTWTKQNDLINIDNNDFIATDPKEVYSILISNKIKNILYTGFHANMCIVDRPTGMRKYKQLGFNCYLVESCTDIMFNSKYYPNTTFEKAFENVMGYISKTISPTIIN